MKHVYLNGQFKPEQDAKISPMDRGFLFGDGVYEVIPCYRGRLVGFNPHIERLSSGLSELNIELDTSLEIWRDRCLQLCQLNGNDNFGIYIQVSRGADSKRHHGYPKNISPTIFMFTFAIPNPPEANIETAATAKVVTTTDKRWQRCHIKSTSLLGNVLHYQQSVEEGAQETLLFDENDYLTEASISNVFIVKDHSVITPPLSHQLLPGITRYIVLAMLREHSDFKVIEAPISKDQVLDADEVWITSSTKEIMPVVAIDNKAVRDGRPGKAWLKAQTLFSEYKFDY
jgi:D-alanine transaminase